MKEPVFLLMNGIELNADEDSLEKIVISTAEGKIDKATIAQFIRTHTFSID